MRTWIGAAIVAYALGGLTPAVVQASDMPSLITAQLGQDRAITDFSARHRGHAHKQRAMRGHKYRVSHRHRGARAAPAYGAQPYGYRPDGMAPFFPFGFGGYGFQPSW